MMSIRRLGPRSWRYSLRALLAILTVACVYFGCWEITKKQVVATMMKDPSLFCETPVPFVAVLDELDADNYRYVRRYHFCIFSQSFRLPYVAKYCERKPLIMGGAYPRIILEEKPEDRLLGGV